MHIGICRINFLLSPLDLYYRLTVEHGKLPVDSTIPAIDTVETLIDEKTSSLLDCR